MYGTLYPFFNLSTEKVYFFSKKTVLRRFVPQLCTKTPDKQIQNVESTCFTRKKKHKSKRPNNPGFIDRLALTGRQESDSPG